MTFEIDLQIVNKIVTENRIARLLQRRIDNITRIRNYLFVVLTCFVARPPFPTLPFWHLGAQDIV